jgi:hypothetical protein
VINGFDIKFDMLAYCLDEWWIIQVEYIFSWCIDGSNSCICERQTWIKSMVQDGFVNWIISTRMVTNIPPSIMTSIELFCYSLSIDLNYDLYSTLFFPWTWKNPHCMQNCQQCYTKFAGKSQEFMASMFTDENHIIFRTILKIL